MAVRALFERSAEFLLSSKTSLEKGLYDVACFEADQALQLALKAHIQKLGGSVPRNHSIRLLLSELGSLAGMKKDANELIKKDRAALIAVEDAYLRARYGAERCVKEDAELCIKIAKRLSNLQSHLRSRQKMLQEWRVTAERVALAAREIIGEARVMVFGSVIKGEAAASSDIDILIVSDRLPKSATMRAEIKKRIEERAGLPPVNPVEMHLATDGEVEASAIYREALKEALTVHTTAIAKRTPHK